MNKYYVYIHRNVYSGEVFYVGRGCDKRAYSRNQRSVSWKEYVKANGNTFFVEIIIENLSFRDSEILEDKYINHFRNSIVNSKHSSATNKHLLHLGEFYEYSPSSPTFLRSKKTGNSVGSVSNSGYVVHTYRGVSYRLHRVIWTLVNNCEIPDGMVINHIDCDRANNHIDNLECVSQEENSKKQKQHISTCTRINNSTGINGVCLRTCTSKNYKYDVFICYWQHEGKTKTRTFSINKYGYDEAYRLACEWRKQMEELYYK